VDADRFAQAVRAARAARSGAQPPEAALAEWRRAYEWYRGDLLGAFVYEDWSLAARERLRDGFLDALFQLARAALERGSPDDARGLASRILEIDATEERAHRLLMRCYALLGRPAEALRQFERCRAALWDELGARPAPFTVSLFESIRDGAAVFGETEEGADQPAAANGALRL
jgi:DNA-binding SARP family transcriptional activator